MIDRYLIRYFLYVIDCGSFSAAALACRVSQPTLSVGIAKLERLVGQPLFDRSRRRVALTEAGTAFAAHARRIEAEFAAAERAMHETGNLRLVRLGVAPTFPTRWLDAALAELGGGEERLELFEGRLSDLRARLASGRIDAVLGPVAEEAPGAVLCEEGYALALPAGHRFAGRAQVAVEEIASEPMVVRRSCEALPLISRFFTDRGVRATITARTTNDDRAIAYVRSGFGITVMPESFAAPGIVLRPLIGFDVRRKLGFTAHEATWRRFRSTHSCAVLSAVIARISAGEAP